MKKKILILDDKETIAKVLSIYLMSDYDVQWLPDGLQGVKWLRMASLRTASRSCISTYRFITLSPLPTATI